MTNPVFSVNTELTEIVEELCCRDCWEALYAANNWS